MTRGKRKRCTKFEHGYRDEIAAKLALADIGRKKHERRAKTEKRAYQCDRPECEGRWHLTSREER